MNSGSVQRMYYNSGIEGWEGGMECCNKRYYGVTNCVEAYGCVIAF